MAVVMPNTRMRRARQYPDDLMEQHEEVVMLHVGENTVP